MANKDFTVQARELLEQTVGYVALYGNKMTAGGIQRLTKEALTKLTAIHQEALQGASEKPTIGEQPPVSKSLPWSWRGEEQPVYVIQRRPFETHSAWEIWVRHEGIKISPVQLTKLLADVLQSQVKVTDLATTDSVDITDTANPPKEADPKQEDK